MPIPFPIELNPAADSKFIDVVSIPGGGNNVWELYEAAHGSYTTAIGDQCLWVVQSAFNNFSLQVYDDGTYDLYGHSLGATDLCAVYMWDESASAWQDMQTLTLTVNNVVGIPPLFQSQSWPVSLQQYLNQGAFSQNAQETNIRTNVETGPFKVRRRFTQPVTNMDCQIWMPKAEYPVLEDFYNVTLQNGTLPFEFVDPITGVLRNWRFKSPYKTGHLGASTFIVNMEWEAIDDAA
jgi:hypothetical protein